ncbi:hypothetical protein DCC85_15145 [Paenibacillus sp. CAA11]|uniref:hypothetical protein n=1 Tax=Paenibacillus sp. CAA11 TaxID=1532905 RepID=UPI000D3B67A0|nr:hypothetical protein [Paenibacillus sp. CAA11]AWB45424.1 hypothetical protein DCC85_15145 [Paenibacillus sp. CAA11]
MDNSSSERKPLRLKALSPMHNTPSGVLRNYILEQKPVNEFVSLVSISADAPNPGYDLLIHRIEFEGEHAAIYTRPVPPVPGGIFPQVITRLHTSIYLDAKYTARLGDDSPEA